VLSIIVAHARNGVIGHRGELPWRLPSDLRRFRELTLGGTVLMGRRTFESLPAAHRPLRERRNLVISSDPDFAAAAEAEVHTGLDAALAACGRSCFVIGGSSVYAQALDLADRVYATEIDAEPQGDTFFTALAAEHWLCVEESEPLHENGHTFVFRVYDRCR
jgi:dihydrofolate reductase